VRNAGREDQAVRTTTLTALDPTGVDMLTTVIVGNRTTVDLGGMLYTPRGYQTKEAK